MHITQQDMFQTIEEKREEMLLIAKCYGINDDRTLKCSQDLDELINKYQQLIARTSLSPQK